MIISLVGTFWFTKYLKKICFEINKRLGCCDLFINFTYCRLYKTPPSPPLQSCKFHDIKCSHEPVYIAGRLKVSLIEMAFLSAILHCAYSPLDFDLKWDSSHVKLYIFVYSFPMHSPSVTLFSFQMIFKEPFEVLMCYSIEY